jgi:hypothetical protein
MTEAASRAADVDEEAFTLPSISTTAPPPAGTMPSSLYPQYCQPTPIPTDSKHLCTPSVFEIAIPALWKFWRPSSGSGDNTAAVVEQAWDHGRERVRALFSSAIAHRQYADQLERDKTLSVIMPGSPNTVSPRSYSPLTWSSYAPWLRLWTQPRLSLPTCRNAHSSRIIVSSLERYRTYPSPDPSKHRLKLPATFS